MKQAIYGLMPWSLLLGEVRRSRITFYKPVERLDRPWIVPDNLIFWEQFRGRRGYNIPRDSIRNARSSIPIDAFDTKSNVFRHEARAPNVSLYVLTARFGDAYLREEFDWLVGGGGGTGRPTSIPYKKCTIFRREY
jgi:hypothetical protein